jgi:hypothetical protein
MLTSMCGIVVDIIYMSTNDRVERKQYKCIYRLLSEMVAWMMIRFLNTVATCKERNSPYMRS